MDTHFTLFWRSILIYVDCYENIGEIDPSTSNGGEEEEAVSSSLSSLSSREIIPYTSLNASRYLLKYFGARLSDQLHCHVTHVLVDPDHPERFEQVPFHILCIFSCVLCFSPACFSLQ
jgi:hypothetical protein